MVKDCSFEVSSVQRCSTLADMLGCLQLFSIHQSLDALGGFLERIILWLTFEKIKLPDIPTGECPLDGLRDRSGKRGR